MGPYLSDTLKRRLVFLTGKGGVGKTTLSLALATAALRQGAKVAIVSLNPFASEPPPPCIPFYSLEPEGCFREYALKILRFERLYTSIFDNKVLRTFIRAAPGLSDTVIGGKIWELVDSRVHDLLIVDLPSSGHAVSFFRSPRGVSHMFKHGFVHEKAERINTLFTSPEARIDLVVTPTEFSVTEALELRTSLLGIAALPLGFCLRNQLLPDISIEESSLQTVTLLKRSYDTRRHQEEGALAGLAAVGLPSLALPVIPNGLNRIGDLAERLSVA
ncbi:MAG: hypothetical protein HYR96_09815 [Deltaproteobacteria bacterium]|nr:hypothetical protein [Deltaproteobacteria bacterium]MBI3294390.1 hypothetical protein [Deltaproteobacteria bacterium]